MMIHIEGPIVESFYDMALITWNNEMRPPLPLLAHPVVYDEDRKYEFGAEAENMKCESWCGVVSPAPGIINIR